MASKKWSHYEDQLLRQMWDDGLSYAEISEKLDRSPGGIEHRKKDLGLPQRRPSPGMGVRSATRCRAAEPHRARKWISKDDPAMGITLVEASMTRLTARACDWHLIDLLREFGGGTIGEARARYRERHELDIPHERDTLTTTYTSLQPASYCGSPAALCGGY